LSVTVTIERQTRLHREAETQFTEIYEESFPPSERDETADLIASIAAGERLCFLAQRDGVVVGLAVVFTLQGPRVAFLEYLAVAPSERNAGIGSSMLTRLEAHLRTGGNVVGVVFEVDPPEEADGDERTLRERRISSSKTRPSASPSCGFRSRMRPHPSSLAASCRAASRRS
jgi:GNAT superfamily N-acetyltransferase